MGLGGRTPVRGRIHTGAGNRPGISQWQHPAVRDIYLIVWYLGPMNRIPHMDFAGVTPESISMRVPLMFLTVGGGLALTAVMARRARIEA